MRKYLYLASILLCLGLSSCSEEWMNDIVPTDKIMDDEAFNTLKDGRNALNGVYSTMQLADYYGAGYLTYGDLKAIDFRTFKVGNRYQSAYLFNETTDSSDSNLWYVPYKCLVSINNAIVNIEKMEVTSAEVDAKKEIIANFYALRALCHFDLLKIFSRIPASLDGDKSGLGVVISNKVITKNEQPERSTIKECYDLIHADLKVAAEKMPATAKTAGWFSTNAIKALVARVYLYEGDMENAYKNASEVIESGKYSLTPATKYVSSWTPGAENTEAILTIINSEEDNPGRDGIGYLTNEGGYSAMVCTKSFMSVVKSDVNDVRKDIFDDKGFLMKYPEAFNNKHHIIRLSEMYLIAAEAGIKDHKTEATKYLNDLIKIRTNDKTSITEAELNIDRVLLERRKELVGEGHIFFDLLRNKRNIVRTGDDHLKSAPMLMKYNDYKTIQPIPRVELNANKKIQQNPTYQS